MNCLLLAAHLRANIYRAAMKKKRKGDESIGLYIMIISFAEYNIVNNKKTLSCAEKEGRIFFFQFFFLQCVCVEAK